MREGFAGSARGGGDQHEGESESALHASREYSVPHTPRMSSLLARLSSLLTTARSALRSHHQLVLENLALRQQLAVLRLQTPRPALRMFDRVFWVTLSRVWPKWKDALCVVKPATVIAWHRAGIRLFWRWRSRGGRPPVPTEVQEFVRRLAADNPAGVLPGFTASCSSWASAWRNPPWRC